MPETSSESSKHQKTMSDPPKSNRWIYALIIAGLVGWGLYHAVGAYLFNHNPWRGVVVMACFALFIACWLLLLRTLKPRANSPRD